MHGLKLGGGGGESPPLPTPMQTVYADQLHDSVDHALSENTTMEHAGMHIVNTGRPEQP